MVLFLIKKTVSRPSKSLITDPLWPFLTHVARMFSAWQAAGDDEPDADPALEEELLASVPVALPTAGAIGNNY